MNAATLVFRVLSKMCRVIDECIKKFKKDKDRSSLKMFLIYASKFNVCTDMIYAAFCAQEDDLFYKPLDHPDWQLIFANYSYYEPTNLTKFVNESQGIVDFMALAAAFMSKGSDDSKWKQAFKTVNWAVFFLIFKKK